MKTRKHNHKKSTKKKTLKIKLKLFSILPNKHNNMDIQLKEIQTKGIQCLNKHSEKTLSEMLLYANKCYYNDNHVIPDSIYDILKEFIQTKFPENIAIKMIGAPVKKNKVKLPYEMWSMDKIKPDTDVLGRWVEKYKGNKVVSGKLDGVSGLYSTEGGIPKLYTRGNGKIGQDVSHIIPFLNLPKERDIVIRGEFIIKKETFDKKYTAANPRSFVSGTINMKTPDPSKYMDIDFVAYEVIQPVLKPSEQIKWLQERNIITVIHSFHAEISNELLSEKLKIIRENYEYETDGIIVCDDNIYPRESKNPKHAFAFKMALSDQMAEAKVLDVIWTPSKDGILKPRVQFEPVTINGATLQFASGYNAKFILDNKIGVGSIIEVIRSGDVIPKIVKVMGNAEPKMPNVSWWWNETEVDAIMSNAKCCGVVREKTITRFFVKLGVDGLGPGNIKKLIESGFDSVSKILGMDTEDFLSCEGFQEKKAKTIYKNIQKQVKQCSLARLMAASNLMGRGMGERRAIAVLNVMPDIMISELSEDEKIKLVSKIDGFATKTAELFVKQIPVFVEFVEEIELEYKLKPQKISSNKKSIVFTGIRPSKELLAKINMSCTVQNSVNKTTSVVIAKDKSSNSGKIKKARTLKIPIMSMEEFILSL